MPLGSDRLRASLRWVADVATTLAGPFAGRPTWSYPGRVHLELRSRPAPAAAVESALAAVPGVLWARVNEPAGRVIVAVGDPAPRTAALVAALGEVERRTKEETEHPHPEEPPPALMLAADLGGMAVTVLEWVLGRTPLPAEAAGLVGLVDTMPRLRQAAGRAAHADALKAWLPVLGAAAQGLAPGISGLLVDTAHRIVQVREALALAGAWRAVEPELTGTPERAASYLAPAVRPAPLPPGPAERYADLLLTGAPLGGVTGALVTGVPRRGLQTSMIFTPKPVFAGREAFASELGTVLARRGMVVVDRRALRLLDRIDTVALDERVLDGSPYAEPIEAATGAAGLRLITLDESGDLAEQVRDAQRQGAGVLVVSRDGPALAAADCGVGVPADGGPPPWGAHVILPGGPSSVVHLLGATAAARQVSRDGVRLARAGTAVAAILALTGPEERSAKQALTAVGATTCVTIGYGAWRAWRAVRDPVREPARRVAWHSMPVEDVLTELGAHPDGLPRAPAPRRPRERPTAENPSLLGGVAAELNNPFTPVLAAGAAGSAVLGSIVDAGLVVAVMGMSALVGGAQRTATARTLAALARHIEVPARVLREGRECDEDAAALVPGDIVLLSAGQVVPADCRIIEADGLEADESALTGESLPVRKDPAPIDAREVADRRSMLYEGTSVAAGTARAVVVAVSADTEAGRAMAAAGEKARTSGVADRLAQITRATTPIALGSAAAVTLSGLARGRALRESLAEGVNLAVAAVPEGLPLLVSAAQLAATRRLSGHGVHVRDPAIIEALGRVEVLCFDKTGTLTEGEIRLTTVADARSQRPLAELDDALTRVLGAALRATPERDGDGEHSHLTDSAVAEGGERAGVTRETGARGWREEAALPFEPSRGFHAAVGRAGQTRLLSVKGAPETVLPRCARIRVNGKSVPLSARERRRVDEAVETLAASGHRVLAVAERRPAATGSGGGGDLGEDDVTGLVFVGLLGLADTVRQAATPAVARLRAAGVQIVMLTGDHPSTASAIAATLIPDGRHPRVLTGADLSEMDPGELDRRLPGVDVVARCTPAQKVEVVRCFQRLGRTIAMTGDGANDAAGIRLADVGIALGRTGTPAARAAADLVVADDRLETIVSALVEGRALWASVREALAILVGGNLGEIAFTLLGALATGRSPLTARQLLLVNMLTDLAPSLAIALRAPTRETADGLLQEGPESSLGQVLTHDIVRRAVITAGAAGAAWPAARLTGSPARARTVGLLALVGAQLAQTLQAGGWDRTVLVSALGSTAALAAVVQTPGLSHFFGSVPVGPVGWSIATLAVAGALAVDRLGLLDHLLPGQGTPGASA
ncbi:cation-translocating P-type ATPase [Spongiactinospora sp. TRM90649]|uniref:cation-translocating P-type ATPase n=1 Tax=Spongiactinospora sp. TRM90649 TaxID=3031114 RepID=UPI0023F713FE|nr:cation-translocating P-type ATPase [Spongiactinospora sp. TRM90649]MDF5755657.1 cation-translocating P-type ATPase [Spongiactinospora sp. TRM90649]